MAVDKKESDKYIDELVDILQKVSGDKELLRAFLEDILSPAEYKELGVRWQIVRQLAAGHSQRDVAENLRAGIATVTRGARELADENGGFQQVLQIISKKK
jgi:Trp operon repressor